MYSESFKKYKDMLTKDPESTMYKRIYSRFNTALFGTTRTASKDFVADDGDYESELEQFRNDLIAASTIEDLDVTDAGPVDRASRLPPSLPSPPLQSDRRVSISVTSNVLHTTAASSQVSNIVNSSITVPSECRVEEIPLPSPSPSPSPPSPPPVKVARPAPKKKAATKSVRSLVTTPDVEADAAPAPRDRVTRQTKAAAAKEAPTRALRKRS